MSQQAIGTFMQMEKEVPKNRRFHIFVSLISYMGFVIFNDSVHLCMTIDKVT